ncbi:MAG: Patatin [uncultured Sulfurovum sp.]|uniref:Patatin n=1 Tax=uncultured Sulfurovum sp. TaxID=269237 RepID=A0A6S6SXT7_9BACT|nr:MAG: Patatin [uncultured Sulfurovum sp.]
MTRKFRILSLDGGGIRGLYSARMLKRIEKDCGVDFYNDFDLIVGTSTGSILAGAIVSKIDLDKVVSLYQDEGKNIFKKRWFTRIGLFRSRYNPKSFEKVLKSIFGDTVLGDIQKPLLINATNIGNSSQFVFKTDFNNQKDGDGNEKVLVRDNDIALSDAILASSAAPIYFPPHKVKTHLLADGGLWANSPVLVALAEAKKIFNKKPEDVVILSIGTGLEKNDYDIDTKKWGFLTGWKREKLISMILNLQTKTNSDLLQFLMPKENILRLTFTSTKALPLDKISENSNLLSKADSDFEEQHSMIQNFIDTHIKDISVK